MSYIEDLCVFCDKCGFEYLKEEPLSKHTTFKIGGKCRLLVNVNDSEKLQKLLIYLINEKIEYFIVGKGSNILVSDNGYDGVVLKLAGDFSGIEQISENEIKCLAGTALSELCIFAMKKSLSGLEFAYGIPGTAGGALFMNAGAYGGEIKDVVKSAGFIDENGVQKRIAADKMELSYRKSIFSQKKNMVITDIIFSLNAGDNNQIKEKMNELLQKRKDKQPLEYPSAGSTFKRPEGSYASLLIEQCGLKGLTVGGAQVSEKHSGFVVNKGNATFNDVIELTDMVSRDVMKKTGYKLELEPIILK